MKINKKIFPFIGFIILFSLAYMLIAVQPPKNSLQFVPVWTIDVLSTPIASSDLPVHPFKLGSHVGYYTAEGEVTSLQVVEEKVSLSKDFIAHFSFNAEQTPFFLASGEQSGMFLEAGFPFFEEDRIFLFYPMGNAFSFHSQEGRELWGYENYVPITTFFSNSKGVVAGFADGKIVVFNLQGDILQEFYPGGSEYEIIFGSSLSQSGRYVACLSGLDQQRIVVSDIEGNTSKIIFHKYIEKASLDQRLVYFSEREDYVFVNAADALVVIDIEQKSDKTIPVEGSVVAIKEVHDGNYYFVLSKYRDKSTVSVFNKDMYSIGSFSFNERNTFIDSEDEYVYIGNDTSISKTHVKIDD